MNQPTRREAIKTALIGGLATLGTLSAFAAKKPQLSFSTLGCPTWDLATILDVAAKSGYQAVEFRGLQGELDLPKSPAFNTASRAKETHTQFADRGLHICNLGSSAQLHHADAAKRRKNLDDARRFIELAHQLDCPFVRVFPDSLPTDQNRDDTLRLISDGLLELGTYAKGSSVTVLLESHGELTRSNMLVQIMQAAKHPNVGLIWDIVNMWADASEAPAAVYQKLKPYIRHVHVKDVRIVAGKHQYVQIGQGEAPLRAAIDALKAGSYDGYYSFEWEKLWHPEIEDPERVIPQYPAAIKAYF
ncbi:sugar phosphate isomerase/epimerase family protein [Fibrivirga algicola]|uniref:Sugar phosphate isomerase/epimerase n=1 Tax=Fibrivirga algicola TaxID=2950420 RepID=A0ABX0QE17_9BACT|nr:sugar phosphate isomerase/epimerase family protein [Fibrivirga algicola]NID10148.1 sugar phosphate isomerase/epimerase [Fibrivirga algicola]